MNRVYGSEFIVWAAGVVFSDDKCGSHSVGYLTLL